MPVAVKLVLGALALWGTIYAFAALAGDFAVVAPPFSGRVTPSGMEAFVIHVHAFVALAIFLIEAWIALNLSSLPVSKRVAWVFGMMFFYPLAVPAFWYLYIWRGRPARKPSSPAGPH
jgi:NAD/NADP transhydrogenase beta subunit